MRLNLFASRGYFAAIVCVLGLGTGGGCMRGMTYKVPMPASMTIGTVKEEPATLASASSRGGMSNQRLNRVIASEASGATSSR